LRLRELSEDHRRRPLERGGLCGVSGDVTTYVGTGDSGQPTNLQFCPKCGSRLFTRPSVMPGSVIVSLGTMDASADLAPSMLIYGKRRRSWDHVDPSIPVFEGMPQPPSN
jgi:hypothetical protein